MKLLTRTLAIAAIAGSSACLGVTDSNPAIPIENTTFASSLGVNLAASTKTTNGAYYRDLVVGTGPVIASGQTLSVRYSGWLSNGTLFDSNVNLTNAYSFKFGVREVIDGWDEALAGIRVGGQRQLIVPPQLAYGPYGNGPIPPNAVLVFTVEVLDAR
ncbi:MAG: FKBP-type peptidyl-prolyl cis-trans isomerase [Gemmatimonadaceae bacterium]